MTARRLILRDWEASAWQAGRLSAVVRLAKRVPENARRAERLSAEHFQYWAGPKRVIIRCPLGPPGQRLWIAETWGVAFIDGVGFPAVYKADGEQDMDAMEDGRWKSPTIMPQSASRSTAVHLGSRLVRSLELDVEDCIAFVADHGQAAWDANAWCWLHRIGRA